MLARLAIIVALSLSAASAQAAEIFRRTDGWVVVKGPFESSDGPKFVELANSIKGGMTVVFESPGGAASAAVAIGNVIHERGWATIVFAGKTCASACAFAWIAGKPRIMDRDAHIGFHAVYVIENGQPVVSGPANAIIGGYLANLGLPPAAIYFATLSKPDGMSWITQGRAKNLGFEILVLDKPWERKWPKEVQTVPTKEGGSLLKQLYGTAQ